MERLSAQGDDGAAVPDARAVTGRPGWRCWPGFLFVPGVLAISLNGYYQKWNRQIVQQYQYGYSCLVIMRDQPSGHVAFIPQIGKQS